MGYSEALEAQIDTLKFAESKASVEWFNAFYLIAKYGAEARTQYDKKVEASAQEAVEFLRSAVGYGTPYFWASNFCKVLGESAKDMPNYTLMESSLPSNFGFVWFESCPYSDIYKESENRLRAFAWTKATDRQTSKVDCIWLTFFLDTEKGIRPFTSLYWLFGEDRDSAVASYVGQMERNQNISNASVGRTAKVIMDTLSIFAAMLVFMEQRIFVQETRVADRALRRRLEASKAVSIEPLVKVILLRRKHYEAHTHKESVERDYACQWVVRGHWRNQWYPSLQRNQPKWILPYVKGPEDKPLKPPRATVFAVVR